MGRRSDHSREEIQKMAIDAASRIVENEGFQSLTARKVASKIGYTVGTLYHVFRNFDDLVIHMNAQTIDEIVARMQKEVGRKRRPEARIRAMAAVYVDFATEHPDRWRVVFEHRAPPGVPTPELMGVRRDIVFEMVAENFRELSPNHIPQEVAHAATALWSGIHGVCILALTGKLYLGGAFSMSKLVNTLIDSVLNEFQRTQSAD